ncbi:hypothetical protein [Candidatus Brocadia sapporoensis]|nr:hypothetical protein [Candidatus Brocadia sapporoensis]
MIEKVSQSEEVVRWRYPGDWGEGYKTALVPVKKEFQNVRFPSAEKRR